MKHTKLKQKNVNRTGLERREEKYSIMLNKV